MNLNRNTLGRAAWPLMIAAAVLASASMVAEAGAGAKAASAKPARAGCPYGIATDGSANCMTKADFDVAQARQAALDRDPAQYVRNALTRCESLSGADRQDCVARIEGKGTTSGSVEGGGIYRELVTREVGAVPAAALPAAVAPSDEKK